MNENCNRNLGDCVSSATNFTFTFINRILNVTFMSCYVGHRYVISLHPLQQIGELYEKIHSVKCVQSVMFETNEFLEDQWHIISITCQDVMRNNYFKSDEFYLSGYKTNYHDCTCWNVHLLISPSHRQLSITVKITPKQGYQSCFESYMVELHRFNVECQIQDSSLNKTKGVPYNSEAMIATFTDLSPGNYCVKLTAKDRNCFNSNCGVRISQGSNELKELKYDNLLELKEEENELNIVAIALPLGIISIVFLVGVFAVRMLKSSNYQLPVVASSHRNEYSGTAAQTEGKVVVSILHAQSVPLEQEVTLAIYNFLKDCCNVHPVIVENDPRFFINSSAWIQQNYDYGHLSNDTMGIKHKVLVLETDASVTLYNHWMSLGKGQEVFLTHLHYSSISDIFLRGLTELLSSPEFLGTDHYHIIVVRFPYSSNRISRFKQKRIYLPDQTVELYNSLWDNQDLLYDNVSLKNKWLDNAAYKDLLRTIEQMSKYVEQSPQYLDNF